MQATPTTVAQYLRSLPADRRRTIKAIRAVILDNIDGPFAEGIQGGSISYHVPHSVFPAGYHCNPEQPLPFAGIASQKHHIGLYLFCVYSDPTLEAWFREAWLETGQRLDMGKSCVRFKTLEHVPLEVVGELFRRVKAKAFIAQYQASRRRSGSEAASKGR
jgi:hypothetical protein